jgi:hypothetical protein
MQAKPFYKLSVLQKAREALGWFFDKPRHDLAHNKQHSDMER